MGLEEDRGGQTMTTKIIIAKIYFKHAEICGCELCQKKRQKKP
jgi:hypothetical protein